MELDTRIKAAIETIAAQRNQALDMIANLIGENAVLREQLEAAKKASEPEDKERLP